MSDSAIYLTAHTRKSDDGSEVHAVLQPNDARFKWVQTRVAGMLESHDAPSLSASALKLLELVKNEDSQLEDLERIIALDAGLTARCIKVASSTFYGGRAISSINQALMMIGFTEIRRVAFTVGVIDSFSRLKIKVDWKKFWLHSMLVGRLTQSLAGAFREITGSEYLAGLMHDTGKLVIEHDFPREFELIILRSMERQCGHATVERDLLGIDHTQIGAAMCHVMKVSAEVRHAVHRHHDHFAPHCAASRLPDRGFLAACVSVADALANLGGASMSGARTVDDWEHIPAWQFLLENFDPPYGLDLDLETEIRCAEEDLNLLGG